MGKYDEFLIDKPPTSSGVTSSESQPAAVQSTETQASTGSVLDLETLPGLPQDSTPTENGDSSDAGGLNSDGTASDAPVTATLPDAIASREQTLALKPRYKGHTLFNNQTRRDWMKIIESHFSSYQALLYLPDADDVGEVDDETGFEKPSFTELNNNQRSLNYTESDPVLVTVLDCPDERASFQVVDADGEQDGLTDDVLILRIAAEGVPVGSILEWNEELASGRLARRFWYVHRIYGYGTQNVGSLYYCIPARNFDTTSKGRIE